MEGFVMKQAPQAVPKQKAPLLSYLWVTFQGSCLAGLLQASPPECGTAVGGQAVLNRQGPERNQLICKSGAQVTPE